MKKSLPPNIFKTVQLLEQVFSSEGLSPSAGRIVGYLMMSSDPISFSDLASDLEISRGGVSENTKFLESIGILIRTRHPGDRRDYFLLRDNADQIILERAMERRSAASATIDDILKNDALSLHQRSQLHSMNDFLKAHHRSTKLLAQDITDARARKKDKQKS